MFVEDEKKEELFFHVGMRRRKKKWLEEEGEGEGVCVCVCGGSGIDGPPAK